MNIKKNKEIKSWIAVYTKSRHENTVKAELKKINFEVYLPLIRKKRRWSDRTKWVDFPLFKSYLFVKTELNEIHILKKIPGLVNVIKFGGKVAQINEKTIIAIKSMLNGHYNVESTDYFIKGDIVIVKSGPLKGSIGEVYRIDNSDRFLIRIDAIKQSISIKIDRRFLKQLGKTKPKQFRND